jgi:hypothetical protein
VRRLHRRDGEAGAHDRLAPKGMPLLRRVSGAWMRQGGGQAAAFKYSVRTSAGVRYASVFRGRLFNVAATAMSSSALWRARLVPLGKYWRSSPLVFSLVPRCHGLRGSQK